VQVEEVEVWVLDHHQQQQILQDFLEVVVVEEALHQECHIQVLVQVIHLLSVHLKEIQVHQLHLLQEQEAAVVQVQQVLVKMEVLVLLGHI
jgi:hypothetical protein